MPEWLKCSRGEKIKISWTTNFSKNNIMKCFASFKLLLGQHVLSWMLVLCVLMLCVQYWYPYIIYIMYAWLKQRKIRSKKKQKSGIFLAKMGQIELPHIFDVHIIFVFGANHKFLICSTASCIGCCPDHRKVELWAHALFQHSVHEVTKYI